MKKILFVAFAATLMAAGCQKTEIINRVGDRIGFSTQLDKITKAVGDGADAAFDGETNLLAQDFRVWAYYVAADPNTGAAANSVYDGMKDQLVESSKDGEEIIWTPDKVYYWPGKGKDLKFFAVSGVAEGDAVVDEVTHKVKVSDFKVDPTKANVDLMVADFVQQNQSNKEVALQFNHALAKVEFLFKTTSATTEKIFVQKLEVEELTNVGTLEVGTAAGSNFGTTAGIYPLDFAEAWSYGTTPNTANFADDYVKPATDFPSTYTPYGETDKIDESEKNQAMAVDAVGEADVFTTWLMIPQTIANKDVVVTYLIDNRQFEAIFDLDSVTEKWEQNQYIRYTITLAPNKISFSANVKPWNESDKILGETEDETPVEPAAPNSVEATFGADTVTLYYEGELAAETAVYTDADLTVVAAEGDYTLADGRVVTVAAGKVTTVTSATPAA